MLYEQRHSGVRAVLAVAAMALLVLTAASQFTLFVSGVDSDSEGAAGAYTRFESPPVEELVRGGVGSGNWVLPVMYSLAAAALLIGGAWLLRRALRRRAAPLGTVASDEPDHGPTHASSVLSKADPPIGVEAAWRAVELLTVDGRGTLTVARTTASTSGLVVRRGAGADKVTRLARLYDRARYSTHPLVSEEEAEARQLSEAITREVLST